MKEVMGEVLSLINNDDRHDVFLGADMNKVFFIEQLTYDFNLGDKYEWQTI